VPTLALAQKFARNSVRARSCLVHSRLFAQPHAASASPPSP